MRALPRAHYSALVAASRCELQPVSARRAASVFTPAAYSAVPPPPPSFASCTCLRPHSCCPLPAAERFASNGILIGLGSLPNVAGSPFCARLRFPTTPSADPSAPSSVLGDALRRNQLGYFLTVVPGLTTQVMFRCSQYPTSDNALEPGCPVCTFYSWHVDSVLCIPYPPLSQQSAKHRNMLFTCQQHGAILQRRHSGISCPINTHPRHSLGTRTDDRFHDGTEPTLTFFFKFALWLAILFFLGVQ